LLIILSVSVATVFAASTNTAQQKSMFNFETQMGYSTNVVREKVSTGSDYTLYDLSLSGLSLGEKVTVNTNYFVDFTAALTVNFTMNETFTEKDYILGVESTNTGDFDSDFYQNSLNFFIGAEKTFMIAEDFCANVGLGPNVIYFFENTNSGSSFFGFGIAGFANINYNINPSMKLSLGISASYSPFLGGEAFDFTKPDGYSDSIYSITPTIGFGFSL
jgi:hypothetical protein